MKNSQECTFKVGEFEPELSCPIVMEQIQGESCIKNIIATEEQCRKLGKRFGIIKLEYFTAKLKISRASSDLFAIVRGNFTAGVIQRCVITLEPILSTIKNSYECKYSDILIRRDSETIDFDIMKEDPPEPIFDGQFDAGIILTEELGLELDPFPRSLVKRAYKTPDNFSNENYKQSNNSPFAVLKKLK